MVTYIAASRRKKVCCLLLSLVLCLLPLSACSGGEELPEPEEEISEPEIEETEDPSPEDLEPPVTELWAHRPQELSQLDVTTGALYIAVPGGELQLSDGTGLFSEDALQVGDPGGEDVFTVVMLRHPDAVLRVYQITDEQGAPYYPGLDGQPVRGDVLYEANSPEGLHLLRLPCLADRGDEERPRYGYACQVEATWEGGDATFYPVSGEVRNTQRDGFASFSTYRRDDLGNPVVQEKEPEEELPVYREEERYDPPLMVFPAPTHTISRMQDGEWGEELADIVTEVTDSSLTVTIGGEERRIGLERSTVYRDDVGRYYIYDWSGKEEIVWYDRSIGAWQLTETGYDMSSLFQGDGYHFYRLPESSQFLMAPVDFEENHSGGYQCFLLAADFGEWGFPFRSQPQSITWIINEVVDEQDPGQGLMLGVTTGFSFWGNTSDEAVSYLALWRTASGYTRWFQTGTVHGSSGYDFPSLLFRVIAGRRDDFITPQPYEATFRRGSGQVEVRYPSTGTTLVFDFERFRIDTSTHYTQELLGQQDSSYIVSSPDGRYQIWKIFERWYHEASSYSVAVYDTATGTIDDLGRLDSYFRPSFYDAGHLSLVETFFDESLSINDFTSYTEYTRAAVHQTITKYNLRTRREEPVRLELGDLSWSHTIWNHIWLPGQQRHYLLSMPTVDPYENSTIKILNPEFEADDSYGNRGYYLSVFDSSGAYLGSYRTGIPQFGGKFVYYHPAIVPMEDGKLLVYDPYREENQFLVDTADGAVEQGRYPYRERELIDRYLQSLTYDTDDIYAMQSFFRGWAEVPGGAAYCRYLLEGLERQAGDWLSQIAYIDEEYGLILFYEFNNSSIWQLQKDEDESTWSLVQTDVPFSTLSTVERWDVGDETYWVTINDGNNGNRIIRLLHRDRDTGIAAPLSSEHLSDITPPHVTKLGSDSLGISFHGQRFSGYRMEPGEDAVTFTYWDEEREERVQFLQLVWDGGFLHLYP